MKPEHTPSEEHVFNAKQHAAESQRHAEQLQALIGKLKAEGRVDPDLIQSMEQHLQRLQENTWLAHELAEAAQTNRGDFATWAVEQSTNAHAQAAQEHVEIVRVYIKQLQQFLKQNSNTTEK